MHNIGQILRVKPHIGPETLAIAMCNPFIVLSSGTVVQLRDVSILEALPHTPDLLKQMSGFITKGATRAISCTTGSDPEIFAFGTDGQVLPAWKWLPDEKGAKAKPENLDGLYSYWDGFQAELSSSEGYYCHDSFTYTIQRGLRKLNLQLQASFPGAQLKCEDVVKVPQEMLFEAADAHVALGCAPSLNAYGIPAIEIGDARYHPLRYSGCHLHYRSNIAPPAWFPNGTVVMMDKVLGVVLTALGRDLENPLRRKAYGRPGEHRVVKATGHDKSAIEYRTPGSFLLRHPALVQFSADIGRLAFRLGMLYDGREFPLPDVKDIILNCDADAAVRVIRENKEFFEGAVTACYEAYGPKITPITMDVLEKGWLRSALDLRPVDTTWHLELSGWRERWTEVMLNQRRAVYAF